MKKSETLTEQQRCSKVVEINDDKSLLRGVTVWTTTNVPDVAVLVVGYWNSREVSTSTYNGTNYWWFKELAVGAAKGANNNVTVPYRNLPRESGIFVCNPLNNSALFDVLISVEFTKVQASHSGTEWVGKKSMSVAPSNSDYQEVIAQFEFDEPCNETLEVNLKFRGRQKGATASLTAFLVAVSLFVPSIIALVLMVMEKRCCQRLCFRFGSNNWKNIPDK